MKNTLLTLVTIGIISFSCQENDQLQEIIPENQGQVLLLTNSWHVSAPYHSCMDFYADCFMNAGDPSLCMTRFDCVDMGSNIQVNDNWTIDAIADELDDQVIFTTTLNFNGTENPELAHIDFVIEDDIIFALEPIDMNSKSATYRATVSTAELPERAKVSLEYNGWLITTANLTIKDDII